MRVRKKPVEVEAMKLHKENIEEVAQWANALIMTRGDNLQKFLNILTLEGTVSAQIGDWIIKGVNGEFYPCKHDIFMKTYDIVEGDIPEGKFPFIEVISITDNDDGTAEMVFDMDMRTMKVFAKYGLVTILREEAERVLKEHGEMKGVEDEG